LLKKHGKNVVMSFPDMLFC